MRTILITGASGGIGRAIAETLADRETKLILHGRNITKLEQTCGAVREKGATIIAFPADFQRQKDLDKFIAAASKHTIDAIIHNAGVALVEPFETLSLEDWNKALHINVTVPFYLTQKLVSKMSEGGTIVSILSVAAKIGFPGWSSYCAGKAALMGFAQSIREELRSRKIRVCNIFPAATDTDIWNSINGEWDRSKMMPPDEIAKAVAYAIAQSPGISLETIELGAIGGNL